MTRTGTSPQTAPGLPGRPGLRRSRRAATWCGPYPGSHIWRGMTAQSRQMIKYQNRRECWRHGGSRFDWSDHSHRRQRAAGKYLRGTHRSRNNAPASSVKRITCRGDNSPAKMPSPWERAGHELRVRNSTLAGSLPAAASCPQKTASRHRGDVELLHVHALSNCKKNPWAHRGLSCRTTPPTRQ
jgi:hypothetical protein